MFNLRVLKQYCPVIVSDYWAIFVLGRKNKNNFGKNPGKLEIS